MVRLCFSSFILLAVLSGLGAQELELPSHEPSEALIRRQHYTLLYNERFEQAAWVAYELTREEVMGPASRTDYFVEDPLVDTGSAHWVDYLGSGYDRGHLAPAADMKISVQAMSDSFFMSNISPQAPGLNREIWAFLESCVRTWAWHKKAILVVTGPVITQGWYRTIGENNVLVPRKFFKVILDYQEPGLAAVGFVLPNQSVEGDLEDYAMTVDQVEAITGLDFFPGLPDEQETILESRMDLRHWPFQSFQQSDYR